MVTTTAVAHPDLIPIELAWLVIKGCMVKHSKLFEVEVCVPWAVGTVTPAMWKKLCNHAEKVEEEYWKKDGLKEDVVEEILISDCYVVSNLSLVMMISSAFNQSQFH